MLTAQTAVFFLALARVGRGRMEVGLKELEMLGGSAFLCRTGAGLAPEPAFIYSIISINLDDSHAQGATCC